MDLINRQDAIDACLNGCCACVSDCVDEIEKLPSAEPVIRCKDCKHYHTFANGMSVSWCDFGYSREIDISDWWYCADAEPKEGEEE